MELALCGHAVTSGCSSPAALIRKPCLGSPSFPLQTSLSYVPLLFIGTSLDSHKEPQNAYYAYSGSFYLSKIIH